jgi:hypothetical protein
MRGTLRTQSFVISSTKLSFKYRIAEQKRHQFCSMVKKFHPRINLATLFSTKSYHLNTIKPFFDHENRSLTKCQKSLQGGYPELQNSEYAGHQVGLKDSGSRNLSSLGLMV